MPVTSQRALDYLTVEWPSYVSVFKSASAERQAEFLHEQGYARLADLLAHVAVWWEEAYGIMLAAVEGREVERKKYDFDQFNAAAVARFKGSSEEQVLAFFEEYRQKFINLLREHPNAVEQHRLVARWFYAVVIHHGGEHAFAASRFLTLDWLSNDWAEYIADWKSLPAERQQKFLEKQGFSRFRDVVAHLVAWFEEAHTGITGFVNDPAYKHPSRDIDAFNADVVEKYGAWQEEDVYAAFESARVKLVELVNSLSDEMLWKPRVQSWLMGDVIEHYFEHEL